MKNTCHVFVKLTVFGVKGKGTVFPLQALEALRVARG
jgi:hypothetical protein